MSVGWVAHRTGGSFCMGVERPSCIPGSTAVGYPTAGIGGPVGRIWNKPLDILSWAR